MYNAFWERSFQDALFGLQGGVGYCWLGHFCGFTAEAGTPFFQADGEGLGFYIIDNPLGKKGRPASAVKPC